MTSYEVWTEAGVEVRRTDRRVAEDDVRIFRWLGKEAWINEVEVQIWSTK